jgi:hypothetical protein
MRFNDREKGSNTGSLLRDWQSEKRLTQILQQLRGTNPLSRWAEEQGGQPSPVLKELIEVLVGGLLEEPSTPSRDEPPEEKEEVKDEDYYEGILIQLLKDIQDTPKATKDETWTYQEFNEWNERTKEECDTWVRRFRDDTLVR